MTMNSHLTHFTSDGRPVMVDVSQKEVTERRAIARAKVMMAKATQRAIEEHQFRKGDVIHVAQLAGIMAAKKTSELIPLCHQVPLHHVGIEFSFAEGAEAETSQLTIEATVLTAYQTGVEMEALTAASVAALTVYDMCKSIDKSMVVADLRLIYKEGGKSGVFQAIST